MKAHYRPIDFVPNWVLTDVQLKDQLAKVNAVEQDAFATYTLQDKVQSLRGEARGVPSTQRGPRLVAAEKHIAALERSVATAKTQHGHAQRLWRAMVDLLIPTDAPQHRVEELQVWPQEWVPFFARMPVAESDAIRAHFEFNRVLAEVDDKDRDLVNIPAFQRARDHAASASQRGIAKLRSFFRDTFSFASLLEPDAPILAELPKGGDIMLGKLLQSYLDRIQPEALAIGGLDHDQRSVAKLRTALGTAIAAFKGDLGGAETYAAAKALLDVVPGKLPELIVDLALLYWVRDGGQGEGLQRALAERAKRYLGRTDLISLPPE